MLLYVQLPAVPLRMLKDYPQLKQVYLCLDHDSAGIEGAYRIADSIHSLGEYQVYRLFPAHKDWDEDLKARMGKDAIPAGEHPKLAYIAEKTAELKEMCLEDTDEYIKYKRMPADLFDDTMRKLERLKKADYRLGLDRKERILCRRDGKNRCRLLRFTKPTDWEAGNCRSPCRSNGKDV